MKELNIQELERVGGGFGEGGCMYYWQYSDYSVAQILALVTGFCESNGCSEKRQGVFYANTQTVRDRKKLQVDFPCLRSKQGSQSLMSVSNRNWIIVLSRKGEVHCLGGPIPIPVEIYVNDSRPSEKSYSAGQADGSYI